MAKLLLQSSSFQISQAFVNSTVPQSASLADIENAQVSDLPNSNFVVCALWHASLTLSLLVAFFSLSLQQWLKYIPIPTHLPTREAIRLRQYRYMGWVRYGGDGLVSMLSLTLQAAVVTFVIGLIDYLRHTSIFVAVPVLALSIIWLCMFACMSLMPLLDPSCPYKTALASIGTFLKPITIVWRLLNVLVATLILLPAVGILHWMSPGQRLHAFRKWVVNLAKRQLIAAVSGSAPTGINMWAGRELKRISGSETHHLDEQALAWASANHSTVDVDLRRCFYDLSPYMRTRCVLEWMSLKLHRREGITALSAEEGTLNLKTLNKIGDHFAAEYSTIFMDILSLDWYESDEKDHSDNKAGFVAHRTSDPDLPYIVMFIWAIISTKDASEISYRGKDLRSAFAIQLAHICCEQESFSSSEPAYRVSSVLFFDVLDSRLFNSSSFSKDGKRHSLTSTSDDAYSRSYTDKVKFLHWARKCAAEVVAFATRWQISAISTRESLAAQELLLSACAAALHLLAQDHSPSLDESGQQALREVLGQLDKYVKEKKTLVAATKPPRYLSDSTTLPFITSRAIASICQSLDGLGPTAGPLPLSVDCPSLSLANRLRSVCDGRQEELEHLDHFIRSAQEVVDEKRAKAAEGASEAKDETGQGMLSELLSHAKFPRRPFRSMTTAQ